MARISVRHSFCFLNISEIRLFVCQLRRFFLGTWEETVKERFNFTDERPSSGTQMLLKIGKSAWGKKILRLFVFLFVYWPSSLSWRHASHPRLTIGGELGCALQGSKNKKTCCLLKISQEFRVLVLRFHCLVGHAGELRSAETNNKTPFKYLSTVRVHIHVERERDASDLAILVSAPPTLSKSAGVLRLESHHIVRLRTIDGTSSTKRDTRGV